MHNNNIPVNIPSHPYILLERNVLCNCDIEAKSNLLLESLAACGEQKNDSESPDLEMYFTVNLAFVNYLDQLDETIDVPIERNWTHQIHVLPISIEPFQMNQNQAPKTLKEYITQYQENRKSLNIKEKSLKEPTFNTFLFTCMVDVIMFLTGILTVVLTVIIMYMLCGQSKLKSVVANLSIYSNYQQVH